MSVNLNFSTKVIHFLDNAKKHKYMYYSGISKNARMIIHIKEIINDNFVYEIVWSSHFAHIGIEQSIKLDVMKQLVHDETIKILDYFDDVDEYMLNNAEYFI